MPASSPDEIDNLEFHEFCLMLPEMSDEELAALEASIRERGFRPQCRIVIWNDMIIDGRHRWIAAHNVGFRLRPEHFEAFEGTEDEAFELVMSLNAHRRHLDAGQRSILAAQARRRSDGRLSRPAAARAMGVSEGYLSAAERVIDRAPELADRVRKGEKTLCAAAREAGIRVGTRANPPEIPDGSVERRTVENPIRLEDVREEYEERAAIRDQDSDEVWVESMPLHGQLDGRRRDLFVRAAINWRHTTEARLAWSRAVTAFRKGNRRDDPYVGRHVRALEHGDPMDWELCSSKDGGCDGRGEVEELGSRMMRCPNCRGDGFLVC